MGDNAVGVKFALNFLTQEMPGIYIKSLQIGPNPAKDIENGFFLNVNEQVTMVCEMLSQDKLLENGYNAIGLSQGGQFLRAVAQRCPNPPMLNLISLGGQHQGVFGLPRCSAPKQEWCEIIDKLLTHAAYSEWVQKFLVQAEYWHDPFKPQIYAENSVFLADINNERVVNKTYRDNLQKLRNLVLVMFEGDTIVQPKDSEWFGYFVDGQDKIMYKMEDSLLYKEDRIGLKALNESGRLHLLSVPGNHLIFSKAWFIRNIVKPFLM
jgi:palmitoyl-protein thioesterase